MNEQNHVYCYPFTLQLTQPGGYWVHTGNLVVSLRSAYRETVQTV